MSSSVVWPWVSSNCGRNQCKRSGRLLILLLSLWSLKSKYSHFFILLISLEYDKSTCYGITDFHWWGSVPHEWPSPARNWPFEYSLIFHIYTDTLYQPVNYKSRIIRRNLLNRTGSTKTVIGRYTRIWVVWAAILNRHAGIVTINSSRWHNVEVALQFIAGKCEVLVYLSVTIVFSINWSCYRTLLVTAEPLVSDVRRAE